MDAEGTSKKKVRKLPSKKSNRLSKMGFEEDPTQVLGARSISEEKASSSEAELNLDDQNSDKNHL